MFLDLCRSENDMMAQSMLRKIVEEMGKGTKWRKEWFINDISNKTASKNIPPLPSPPLPPPVHPILPTNDSYQVQIFINAKRSALPS